MLAHPYKTAIMVSGGEPLLYDWEDIMKIGDHVWYFLTNLSMTPEWIRCAKLVIAAYHKEGIGLAKFTANAKILQDWGIPVFVKVIYTEPLSRDVVEHFWRQNIASSLSPLVGRRYDTVPKQCITQMYKRRFLREYKGMTSCNAGIYSWELRGNDLKLHRCSHWYGVFDKIDPCGDADFFGKRPCWIKHCECEWHQFSELNGSNDNEKWQTFVETGKWELT